MENINQISSLTIREPEVEEFTWDFKIPPRSKLQQNIESVSYGGFNFTGLQFRKGFLAQVDHKWSLTLYSNQINICMYLPSLDVNPQYSMQPSSLQLVCSRHVKSTFTLTFHRHGKEATSRLWIAIWTNKKSQWDDSVDLVRIVFRVARQFTGRCQSTLASKQPIIENMLMTFTKLNSHDFFMNPHLSDVTIQCHGELFPGHRFLLASCSPLFRQMFCKESKSGSNKGGTPVIIDDMTLDVWKQLLKYIYCNYVELSLMSEEQCIELFQVADKFGVEGLKVLCEQEMLNKVTKTNCLAVYAAADEYNAKTLREGCWEIINLNKREVFRDRETFQGFITKYPDLISDLFNFFT